ncbi:Flap endonuclease GEN-like protein 1 [Acropora cervicornis]|uniref:Flap endonuclease GEN-like protein 1 n=1 Tax=Acropora cervicornis TaxID=6130 RepID=A0AAD9PRK4_ACRCE|nr:Flap endonuclease GEN-like protein 1 [Acropora cervicornis]
MGVKQLWNILEPVKEKQTLSDLTNKTLCVDLSFWICEALRAKHLCQHVNKPHLRNLLLRLLKFTEFRVKLVFVMDGRPPELKLETIRKRNESQTGGGKIFGSAYVREGQVVDGCITSDGDAFLYGARTVYKDLSTSEVRLILKCFTGISSFLFPSLCGIMPYFPIYFPIYLSVDLNREKLVAFAVLVGCDYFPQGVRGVGEEKAKKLISALNHRNLLERLFLTSHALQNEAQIVDEYYRYTETLPEHCLKTTSPDLAGLQILPLITNWQMTSSIEQNDQTLVQPQRIVKRRVQHKVECYEIEWQNVSLREFSCETFVTIERRDMFDMAYSTLVAEFNEEEALKKSTADDNKKQQFIDNMLKKK